MTVTDIIIVAVVALVVGLAAFYVYRSKKNGQRCVGCPYAGTCGKNACSCGQKKDE